MALNKEVFQTRTKTAIVYAVVMLTGLLWNEWSFFILFTIVQWGCWHEYLKLTALVDPSFDAGHWFHRIYYPLLGTVMMLAASQGSLVIGDVNLSDWGYQVFRWIILLWFLQRFLVRPTGTWHQARLLFGILYISLSFASLVNLRSGWLFGFSPEGNGLTNALSGFGAKIVCMLVVATIWINDTMAYVVGSFIGKTPLSKWSPKKTWEGTMGGVILSIALIAIVGWMYGADLVQLSLIAGTAAIAGTFGDLLESRLKRMAGVKDSGTFMPGHGGFLDRFDSIILAAPAVWIVCYVMYRVLDIG